VLNSAAPHGGDPSPAALIQYNGQEKAKHEANDSTINRTQHSQYTRPSSTSTPNPHDQHKKIRTNANVTGDNAAIK